MSFIRLGLQTIVNIHRSGIQRVIAVRNISQSLVSYQEQQEQQAVEEVEDKEKEDVKKKDNELKVKPTSDRSQEIPVSTSIQYLQSDAYKETYGDDPVWKMYRRNFKGQFAPKKTRKTCIRNKSIATSNPCPICRDEYLVLDYKNTELINQFISPYNGEIIGFQKTGLCQKQHHRLLVAVHKAKDFGTISFDVPFRKYDYSEWYNPDAEAKDKEEVKEKQ